MLSDEQRPPPFLCPPPIGDVWGSSGICDSGCVYCVEIRPLLVATIHRLPHRIIDSIRPTCGTVSPRDTFRIPSGPSKTAKVPSASRINQPGMVVGFVSGTGADLGLVSCAVSRGASPSFLGRGGAGLGFFSFSVFGCQRSRNGIAEPCSGAEFAFTTCRADQFEPRPHLACSFVRTYQASEGQTRQRETRPCPLSTKGGGMASRKPIR